MSIASEISRLQTAKADIKTEIEGKGVTVPSATTLDGYASLVRQIQTGGGGITGTDVTVASAQTNIANAARVLINAANGSAGHLYLIVAKTVANTTIQYYLHAAMVYVSALTESSITGQGGYIRAEDATTDKGVVYGSGQAKISEGDVYTVYEFPRYA